MSKHIKVSKEMIKKCCSDLEKLLSGMNMTDGKFTFTKSFEYKNRKATIHYTREAWEKQCSVIKEFDKEVAWHGVAHRDGNEASDDYYITDIIVYPQTVTSTTVEMDTEEYSKWLQENYEDERFNHLYAQAHSHVNMATSPSGTDLAHQESILDLLGDNDFYIFMIWNKSMSKTIKIYDLKKDVLFENDDISVVVDGQELLDEFIKESKKMVKDRLFTSQANSKTSYLDWNWKPYNPIEYSDGWEKRLEKERGINKSIVRPNDDWDMVGAKQQTFFSTDKDIQKFYDEELMMLGE